MDGGSSVKVPRRHVVSVLGTDPCVSLPIVGSIEDERLSSSSRATTNVERFEGRAVSGEGLQERVFSLLRQASVAYLLPKSRAYLKSATEGGFRFETSNLRLSSLQEGLLRRDASIFDATDAHYFQATAKASGQSKASTSGRPAKNAIAAKQALASRGKTPARQSRLAQNGKAQPAPPAEEPEEGKIEEMEVDSDYVQDEDEDVNPVAPATNPIASRAGGSGTAALRKAKSGPYSPGFVGSNTPKKFMCINNRDRGSGRTPRGRSNSKKILHAEDEAQAREQVFREEANSLDLVQDLGARIMEALRMISEFGDLALSPEGSLSPEDCVRIDQASCELLLVSQEVSANRQISEAIFKESLKVETNLTFVKFALEEMSKLVLWGCPDHLRHKISSSLAGNPKPSNTKRYLQKIKMEKDRQSRKKKGIMRWAAAKLNLCLSTCRFALSLMILQGMPKFVYKEELLEEMIGTTDVVFKTNVLCKVDAAMRCKISPENASNRDSESADEDDDSDESEEEVAEEEEVIQMVLGHVERIVPMMHVLLSRIKLQDTLALKLARVLLDCFSVELDPEAASVRKPRARSGGRGQTRAQTNIESSLECVKRASLVLIAVIFAKYPSFQDSLLTDIHSKCIRNGLKHQVASLSVIPRTFHLSTDDSRIHVVSALLMFCIQNATVTRDHRAMITSRTGEGADPSNEGENRQNPVFDGRTIRLRWADIVWQSIFQELVNTSAQSTKGGYVDRDQRLHWKQVIHLILRDVLTCFGQVEFPCASLLLQRFTTLLLYKGLKHPEAFIRQTCVDLLGEIMGGLIQKEKHWKSDAFLRQDLETICESLVKAAPNASVSDGGLLHVVEMMAGMGSPGGSQVGEEGSPRAGHGAMLGPRDILQVAYDHFDAEQHTLNQSAAGVGNPAGESAHRIDISGAPHKACVSVMQRAVDLSLDAKLRTLGDQGSITKTDEYMLVLSAKSYLKEMTPSSAQSVDTPDTLPSQAPAQAIATASDALSWESLSQMNSSVSVAIQRERARNFDPLALQKISVYLSCTQTTVASRFGNFFDKLLELCMSDTQQITSKTPGSDKAGTSGGQGTTSSSVQVRSKAMKVLADLCQLDDGSLGLAQDPKVRACFDACIQDDSISVREAAVDLISRLSARSSDLALGYFDLLVHACSDPGASVQKQAVRTLWDACSIPVDFPRRLEAAATIVLRVQGMEESIKARTVKLLRNFWLSTSSAAGDLAVDHLCAVVWTIFCEQKTRSGTGLVVPFTRDHPVVHLFECIFNASCLDCSGSMKMTATEKAAVIKAGKSFCRKIVDAILHEEASGDPAPEENPEQDQNLGQSKTRDDRVLKYLVTLHALAAAEPKLCSRGNNQHYYIECLLPHLLYDQSNLRTQSEDAASRAQAKLAKKSNAEKLTCVLSIISSNIAVADVLGDHVCATLTSSLQKLIGLHDFLSVVAKACELLCRVCKFSAETTHFVTKLMSSILDSLEHHASGGQSQRSSTFLRRRLFVLGHLWRNTPEPADGQETLPPILLRTVAAITQWLVDCDSKGGSPSRALTESPIAIEALRALGMTIFGNAKVALIEEVKDVYTLYMGLDCAPALQVCALRGMTEMIKKEETKVLELQQIQLKESNSFRKGKGGSSALDTVCGEGEVSIAGTVLRFFWEKSVLPLALHVRSGRSGPGLDPQAGDSPSSAVESLADLSLLNRPLKLASMEVFDSVLRQGLVAPWTAVPTLVALCGYPDQVVYTKACQILKSYIMDKRMDFFESKLIDAVQTLYQQTIELSTISGSFHHKSAKILSQEMLAGIGALYNLLWDKRRTKTAFLRVLMRAFAKALQVSGSKDRKKEGLRGPSNDIDLKMLAFCANLCVGLPFLYLEEPLLLIHSCGVLIDQEASYVESSLELMGDYAADIKLGKPVPIDLILVGQKAACVALLIEIRRVLRKVYSVSDAQITSYAEKQNKAGRDFRAVKCKVASGERGATAAQGLAAFNGVEIGEMDHAWVSQCKTFKRLMKQDDLRPSSAVHVARDREESRVIQSPNSEMTPRSDVTTPSDISVDDWYAPSGTAKRKMAMRQHERQTRGPRPKRKLMDVFQE